MAAARRVYVANADSGDISVLALGADGSLTALERVVVGGTVMPLAVSPCRRFLYAARRSEPMAVVSFAIDPVSGHLTRLGEAALPHSMAYIATDRSGRWLLSASYPGHLVAVSPIAPDGVAGPAHQVIPTGPNAHAILAAPSNRHVLATSLGGGVVMCFDFDAVSGTLSPDTPPALPIRGGAGPRHLRFHPDGRHIYLLNELDASLEVLAFDPDSGALAALQTLDTLPPGFDGQAWAADLQLTPDGRFLYACERSSSTLACYRIDAASGHLSLIGHTATETQPRGFAISPDGAWLLATGQLSDHLSRYAIDPASGVLTLVQRIATGHNPNWVEIVELPGRPPLYIRMHAADNVAIVANDGGLPAGTTFADGLTLREHVPQGHKVALVNIAAGSAVLRYNVAIGYALQDIPAGSWVHERLLQMPAARELDNLPIATRPAAQLPPLDGYTFEGYRNPDGSVGTRNILAVTTTVQCVAGVVDFAVKRIKAELLPKYPNVDDVVGLEHTYGCGVAIDAPDAVIPIRTLRNISLNPNFGGEVMVVSLGCEKLQPERLLPPGSIPIVDARHTAGDAAGALDVVCLQDEGHIGFMSMIDSIMTTAERHLARLDARRRETCPASELVVGVQCGGSDAFSGVTANPAVGFATDLLVRAGATVMFSEVTEVRDGIDQLTSRAINAEVAAAMIREMAWYDAYLKRGSVDRSANTTPGNKKGGLSNIVEKAMGSIIKSGTAPISGVLSPGEKLRQKGLIYAATPASDFICGTLQLAAGMNLHIFTTGRGTPYGLAECPVIKVATRSDLARRWHDLMDVDAGRIASGEATIEEVGWELFHLMLDVASGRRQTWAEQWGLANALVLFNPAPVT